MMTPSPFKDLCLIIKYSNCASLCSCLKADTDNSPSPGFPGGITVANTTSATWQPLTAFATVQSKNNNQKNPKLS